MTVKLFNEAMRWLRATGQVRGVRRPQTAAQIAALETRLAVALPLSYREMLRRFGHVGCPGADIYGLNGSGLDGRAAPNVVFVTERARAAELITPSMVKIMVTGYGPFFVIDCAERDGRDESPVYEVGAGGIGDYTTRVADSFGEFLLSEVEMKLGSHID